MWGFYFIQQLLVNTIPLVSFIVILGFAQVIKSFFPGVFDD